MKQKTVKYNFIDYSNNRYITGTILLYKIKNIRYDFNTEPTEKSLMDVSLTDILYHGRITYAKFL